MVIRFRGELDKELFDLCFMKPNLYKRMQEIMWEKFKKKRVALLDNEKLQKLIELVREETKS